MPLSMRHMFYVAICIDFCTKIYINAKLVQFNRKDYMSLLDAIG